MGKLERAIICEIKDGNVKFDRNFADCGNLHLCRNYTGHWHVVVTSGNQIRLGWLCHFMLDIAKKYRAKQ